MVHGGDSPYNSPLSKQQKFNLHTLLRPTYAYTIHKRSIKSTGPNKYLSVAFAKTHIQIRIWNVPSSSSQHGRQGETCSHTFRHPSKVIFSLPARQYIINHLPLPAVFLSVLPSVVESFAICAIYVATYFGICLPSMSCYLLPSIYHLAIYLSFHLIFSLLAFLPSPCLFLARLSVFSVLLIVCRALIGAIAIAMLFPCHRHPHCYCSPMPAATNLLSPPSLRQCCPLPRPCLLPPASYDLPAASRLLSSTFSLPFDFCYLLYSCLA